MYVLAIVIITKITVNGQSLPFQPGCQSHDECSNVNWTLTPACYEGEHGNGCGPCIFCNECTDGVDRTCSDQCAPCDTSYLTFGATAKVQISTTFINQVFADLDSTYHTDDPVSLYKGALQSISKTSMNTMESLICHRCLLGEEGVQEQSECVVHIIIQTEEHDAEAAWQAMAYVYGDLMTTVEPVLMIHFTFGTVIKMFSDSQCVETIFESFGETIETEFILVESFLHTINAIQSGSQYDNADNAAKTTASISFHFLEDVNMTAVVDGGELQAESSGELATNETTINTFAPTPADCVCRAVAHPLSLSSCIVIIYFAFSL